MRQEEVRESERKTDMDVEELSLTLKIKNLEQDIEHEERVTEEVESFLRDQHLEFSAKLTEWTQKYQVIVQFLCLLIYKSLLFSLTRLKKFLLSYNLKDMIFINPFYCTKVN